MRKLISFEQLQKICEDKKFESRGNGFFFVRCKKGCPFCNERVCPEWNTLEKFEKPIMSLSEINKRINNVS